MTHARICTDPAVMMGKPCIKGTRITVELILRKLGAGRSFADLLEAYPKLTEDDLRAAERVQLAARAVADVLAYGR